MILSKTFFFFPMYVVCDFMKILLKFFKLFSLECVFYLSRCIYICEDGEKQQLDDKNITRKFYFYTQLPSCWCSRIIRGERGGLKREKVLDTKWNVFLSYRNNRERRVVSRENENRIDLYQNHEHKCSIFLRHFSPWIFNFSWHFRVVASLCHLIPLNPLPIDEMK